MMSSQDAQVDASSSLPSKAAGMDELLEAVEEWSLLPPHPAHIDTLPEPSNTLLPCLDVADLVSLMRCCTRWRGLCSHHSANACWRECFTRRWGTQATVGAGAFAPTASAHASLEVMTPEWRWRMVWRDALHQAWCSGSILFQPQCQQPHSQPPQLQRTTCASSDTRGNSARDAGAGAGTDAGTNADTSITIGRRHTSAAHDLARHRNRVGGGTCIDINTSAAARCTRWFVRPAGTHSCPDHAPVEHIALLPGSNLFAVATRRPGCVCVFGSDKADDDAMGEGESEGAGDRAVDTGLKSEGCCGYWWTGDHRGAAWCCAWLPGGNYGAGDGGVDANGSSSGSGGGSSADEFNDGGAVDANHSNAGLRTDTGNVARGGACRVPSPRALRTRRRRRRRRRRQRLPALLSGGADACIRTWAVPAASEAVDGTRRPKSGPAFPPAGADAGWHTDSVFAILPLTGIGVAQMRSLSAGAASSGCTLLASGGWDGQVLLSQALTPAAVGGGTGSSAPCVLKRVGHASVRRHGADQRSHPPHSDAVWRLAQCGTTLYSGGWDGRLVSWELASLNEGGVLLPSAGVGAIDLGAHSSVVDMCASAYEDEVLAIRGGGATAQIVSWDSRASDQCVLSTADIEATRLQCVGGMRDGCRLLVTGHESGQVLLWDRRAMRRPLWARAPDGRVRHHSSAAKHVPLLRRVDCGDCVSRAVVSFGYDPQRPWLLYSGHFDGTIYTYDFSMSVRQ